ncbi:hypothetical protein [Desulfonatronovibrio magnus]|uniref:hypothetical protein n=1 Tax=Desulfonatronovibrio magnus TaxID=698827 RepID=UPI0005EB8372|nr:hypothetical protein [Desulfonatronovibrio magnus]
MLRPNLDNYFGKCKLGNVYWENNRPGFNKCQEEAVILGVPEACRINFDEFWEAVKNYVGDIDMLHIQDGVPLSDGYSLSEKLYFISVDSAEKILENIDDLMSCEEI